MISIGEGIDHTSVYVLLPHKISLSTTSIFLFTIQQQYQETYNNEQLRHNDYVSNFADIISKDILPLMLTLIDFMTKVI